MLLYTIDFKWLKNEMFINYTHIFYDTLLIPMHGKCRADVYIHTKAAMVYYMHIVNCINIHIHIGNQHMHYI